MSEFYTPSLLITDYYDWLINQLDIYIEELIKISKEKHIPEYEDNWNKVRQQTKQSM